MADTGPPQALEGREEGKGKSATLLSSDDTERRYEHFTPTVFFLGRIDDMIGISNPGGVYPR